MCFFSPHTDALTPLRSQATPDRAPDHLADGTPAALRDDLISLLGPTAVRSRVTDLVKYTTDASHLFPGLHQQDFGGSKLSHHKESLPAAFVAVSERAGHPLFIPPDVAGNCCATVWHSKGYNAGNILMANRVVESMWRWSQQGALPIVCDASSCTLGLKHEVLDYLSVESRERHKALTIYDSITWADEKLLPNLKVTQKARSATVHPTCSMHTLGIDTTLRKIAAELAEKPFYPLTSTCCAFAGDRGLLHEELTRSATRDEAQEVTQRDLNLYLCANRTCEVGMEHATRAPYESFVYGLEELTRT